MRPWSLLALLPLALTPLGCSDADSASDEDEIGDTDDPGDGDPGDGDPGDGDPTGDGDPGDGDPGDGDPGDGDPGDGDPGDGDPGDGDGDPLPSLPPDFLDQLTNADGCGDVYIAAINDAATLGILFNGADLAATAHELGEMQVRESVLPSADVSLRIAVGTLLNDGCNDVGEGPQVTLEWIAVSGTVTLTVVPTGEPQPWEKPAYATLELSDVTFEGAGLEPVTVESWTVADVYVGWLPG
ncbi:MAG TPA: hypothetical protein VK034_17845 [Enhygromyxa sp.]|nr:hypothetical protein [Enhygromyxa sp.]